MDSLIHHRMMYYLIVNEENDNISLCFKSEHLNLLIQIVTDNDCGNWVISNNPERMDFAVNEWKLITPECNDAVN